MQHFRTSDGYNFYRQGGGTWFDNQNPPQPADFDMSIEADVDGRPISHNDGRLEGVFVVDDRPEVTLYDMDGGLLVAAPTGVRYTNQVGGTACAHPVLEGFFVPLILDAEITDLFVGYWPGNNFPEEHITQLNAWFQRMRYPLEFHRERYNQQTGTNPDVGVVGNEDAFRFAEAWIWVRILMDREFRWRGLSGKEGVITWANSD